MSIYNPESRNFFLKANHSLRVIFSNLMGLFKVVNYSAIIYERRE
jgi:hypothetical protein